MKDGSVTGSAAASGTGPPEDGVAALIELAANYPAHGDDGLLTLTIATSVLAQTLGIPLERVLLEMEKVDVALAPKEALQ